MTKSADDHDHEERDGVEAETGPRGKIPRRRATTEESYRKRYRQLRAAAEAASPEPLTPRSFVDWIIDVKRATLAPSSWRQYRAAGAFGLNEDRPADPVLGHETELAIATLAATSPAQQIGQRVRKTSALKTKRFDKDDLDRICHAALATTSVYRQALADRLQASWITALRPCEWKSAVFQACGLPGLAWELVVANAKHDSDRGHGAFRTLRFDHLEPAIIAAITNAIALARESEARGDHDKLLAGVQRLMHDITRELFPNRKRWPTPYSPRHEASARWKAVYVPANASLEERLRGLAIVAVLMGHATDATATINYGRPRRNERGGGGFPVPVPDPTELARVRKTLKERMLRLGQLRHVVDDEPPSP